MTLRIPKMIDVERRDTSSHELDFQEVLSRQFLATKALEQVKLGDRIAVAVGSRGITNLQKIVSSTLRALRDAGARPFIVPAMGSHGGATPEGQAHVLSEYGITEQAMGVCFDTRMNVRHVGTSENGVEVFLSEAAMARHFFLQARQIQPDRFGGFSPTEPLRLRLTSPLYQWISGRSVACSIGNFAHRACTHSFAGVWPI